MMIPTLALAVALAPAGTFSPEPERQLVRAVYQELVGFNTSYSTGQTTAAAEAMARRLLEAGFPKEDVEICRAVRFILESPSMTGQIILLDAGQHLGWAQPAPDAKPEE